VLLLALLYLVCLRRMCCGHYVAGCAHCQQQMGLWYPASSGMHVSALRACHRCTEPTI